MQENNFFLTNRHLRDLNPLTAGTHDCDPGYGVRSAIRPYVLIHFVFRGTGTLYARDSAYPVQPGQAFLIRQGEPASYAADTADPWYYCWVGFDGALSEAFHQLPAVFSPPEELFRKMSLVASDRSVMEYRLAAELLRLYAFLFSSTSRGNPYVRQVENYIRQSHMQSIRIEHIAKQLNLDRRYLGRLFKAETGISMQQYLLKVRMEAADQYLFQGYSVRESAKLCGYEDVSNFTKLYKKHFGYSPASRRKNREPARKKLSS